MELTPRPLAFATTGLEGMSASLLGSHHANNYTGAVKRLNAIRAELSALDFAGAPGFRINGLKREELVATNSMLLHELYFDSLGGDGRTLAPAMALALEAGFGSVERWRAEFTAMAKALGGGSGWVVLTFVPRDGRLVNQWGADHTDAVAGALPILALDMYEHAYHIDYRASAGAYVDAFMANIDWARVYERYQAAVQGASGALAASQDEMAEAHVLDVRRAGAFEQAASVIPGARWKDPAAVAAWARDVPTDKEVVVYCIHGHEVGRATALQLRALGVNARFLEGGIDAWQAAGRPLEAKGAAS